MFDSDIDTSGFCEVTATGSAEGTESEISDGIEFLDTTELTDSGEVSDTVIQFDLQNEIVNGGDLDFDCSDNVYHAERMSQAEIDRIDDMWQEDTGKTEKDPYHAKPLEISEINATVEPYHAITSTDIRDISDGITGYPDYGDLTEAESLEDSFASQVEAMSFDELQLEQSRLDQLSQMDDLDRKSVV